MSKVLKYREVITSLRNLGFVLPVQRAGAHQTWKLKRGGKVYYVTLAFHRGGQDVPKRTLSSIIRQSGFDMKEFYEALKKKRR